MPNGAWRDTVFNKSFVLELVALNDLIVVNESAFLQSFWNTPI